MILFSLFWTPDSLMSKFHFSRKSQDKLLYSTPVPWTDSESAAIMLEDIHPKPCPPGIRDQMVTIACVIRSG